MDDAKTYEQLVTGLPDLEKQLNELLEIAERNKEEQKIQRNTTNQK